MTSINDPLFQAVFNTDLPRIILAAEEPDFPVMECNASASALIKTIRTDRAPKIQDIINVKYKEHSKAINIFHALQKAASGKEAVVLRLENSGKIEVVPVAGSSQTITHLLVNLSSTIVPALRFEHMQDVAYKDQNLTEELDATNEELSASNDELILTIQALNKAQENLVLANEALEHRVAKRTQELQNLLGTLREERQRLSNIINNLPAGVCILSGPEFVLEDVNDGMLRIWERDKGILGKTLLEFMPELKGQVFPILLAKVYTTGVRHIERDAPVQINTHSGKRTIYMDYSYTPIRTNHKDVDRILVHAEDVTEHTLARLREQQLSEELSVINEELSSSNEELESTNDALFKSQQTLRESEKTLRFMFNAIPQQIWTSMANGKLNYANQVMCNDLGQDMETLLANGFRQYIHPDDLLLTIEKWKFALEHATEFSVECRIRFKDNKYVWHLARAVPMLDHDGIKLWIGTNTNIELQKANEQKKDDFISIASHELKTPLTNIKAFNQLILKTPESAKLQRFATKSSEHISKLEGLINDLLDVTKINAGKLAYEMRPFNFKDLLINSIDAIQQTTTSHQIILKGQEEITYTGDYVRLEQVLQNFLSNAVKYSPKANEVIVDYKLDKNNIVVSVQDFGIGIAEKDFNKLFERYYRVDNSAMHFEGIGLGLYICSEILKRHQGSFWIESQQDAGSTFYFRLPLDRTDDRNPEINDDNMYRNNAVTIAYNHKEERLDVTWNGYQDLVTVQHGCLKIFEMLSKHKVSNVLNDNRNVLGTWSDASDWVGQVWFPMMEKAGLHKFAWIYSSAAFSHLSAKKAADLNYGNVQIKFFSNIDDAINWIQNSNNYSQPGI
jgi:PAS domain S-box-containing protein